METIVSEWVRGLRLESPQQHGNLVCFPVCTESPARLLYESMAEALGQGQLLVSEVSEAGSVPTLRAANKGDQPVLLLDGEELAGAKQNRVLNTSILLAAHSEMVIPVSCTEQGRWARQSAYFADSDNALFPSLRARKVRSVSESLAEGAEFRSDQSEVWAGIGRMMGRSRTTSSSSALRDIRLAHSANLDEFVAACPLLPGQVGILVALEGAPVGLDVVSLPGVWAALHAKLVRSYATELLGTENGDVHKPDLARAQSFLAKAQACRESRFESPGLGHDYRYAGAEVVGSALVAEEEVIHTAFFATEPTEHEAGHIAGVARRRLFRRIRGD